MTNPKEFALNAHKSQTRKGKITPYSFHLFLVNNILETLTEDSNIIATGWLHDTVEDTDVIVLKILNKNLMMKFIHICLWNLKINQLKIGKLVKSFN